MVATSLYIIYPVRLPPPNKPVATPENIPLSIAATSNQSTVNGNISLQDREQLPHLCDVMVATSLYIIYPVRLPPPNKPVATPENVPLSIAATSNQSTVNGNTSLQDREQLPHLCDVMVATSLYIIYPVRLPPPNKPVTTPENVPLSIAATSNQSTVNGNISLQDREQLPHLCDVMVATSLYIIYPVRLPPPNKPVTTPENIPLSIAATSNQSTVNGNISLQDREQLPHLCDVMVATSLYIKYPVRLPPPNKPVTTPENIPLSIAATSNQSTVNGNISLQDREQLPHLCDVMVSTSLYIIYPVRLPPPNKPVTTPENVPLSIAATSNQSTVNGNISLQDREQLPHLCDVMVATSLYIIYPVRLPPPNKPVTTPENIPLSIAATSNQSTVNGNISLQDREQLPHLCDVMVSTSLYIKYPVRLPPPNKPVTTPENIPLSIAATSNQSTVNGNISLQDREQLPHLCDVMVATSLYIIYPVRLPPPNKPVTTPENIPLSIAATSNQSTVNGNISLQDREQLPHLCDVMVATSLYIISQHIQ